MAPLAAGQLAALIVQVLATAAGLPQPVTALLPSASEEISAPVIRPLPSALAAIEITALNTAEVAALASEAS